MDHGGGGMSHNMRDFSNAPQVDDNPGVQTISPMPTDRTGEPPQGLSDTGALLARVEGRLETFNFGDVALGPRAGAQTGL